MNEKVQWITRFYKGSCGPDIANKIGPGYWMMKGSCRAFGEGQVNLICGSAWVCEFGYFANAYKSRMPTQQAFLIFVSQVVVDDCTQIVLLPSRALAM